MIGHLKKKIQAVQARFPDQNAYPQKKIYSISDSGIHTLEFLLVLQSLIFHFENLIVWSMEGDLSSYEGMSMCVAMIIFKPNQSAF